MTSPVEQYFITSAMLASVNARNDANNAQRAMRKMQNEMQESKEGQIGADQLWAQLREERKENADVLQSLRAHREQNKELKEDADNVRETIKLYIDQNEKLKAEVDYVHRAIREHNDDNKLLKEKIQELKQEIQTHVEVNVLLEKNRTDRDEKLKAYIGQVKLERVDFQAKNDVLTNKFAKQQDKILELHYKCISLASFIKIYKRKHGEFLDEVNVVVRQYPGKPDIEALTNRTFQNYVDSTKSEVDADAKVAFDARNAEKEKIDNGNDCSVTEVSRDRQ